MKKLYFLLFTFLIAFNTIAQTSDLFISKYGEGTSNNKFLEIYNGTGSTVNLDNYAFPNVSNAPTTQGAYEFWNTFPSGYMLADGDVFVIAHPSADATILAAADMTFSFLSNGDDGFALVANDGVWNDSNSNGSIDEGEMTGFTILDWLGNWDADPGTGWNVAGVLNATADHTLTRKSTICGPNNDWASSAGTDADNSEWIVGDIDTGWGDLGSFTGCISSPILTITAPADGQEYTWGTTEVSISVSVQNFVVATMGLGDGHIHWTLNGGSNNIKYDTSDEPITVSDGGSYTVYMELVDDGHTPISPAVNATVNFTVENTPPSLPIYEGFDYSVAANLGDQSNWTNLNSGDEIVVAAGNLSYSGLPAPTGNMVNFDGTGFDPYFEFLPVTSGTVYASFIFNITDISAMTDLTDGGYFAAIADGNTSYDARIWVRPNPDASGSTYDVGFGNVSSSPPNTSPTLYNVGDAVFTVISYDIDTGVTNAWINPDSGDFGGSAPIPTLIDTDASPASSISKFFLRQDSVGETPFISFDELRVGTSWNDVTTNALSVNDFYKNAFKVYPNPTSLGYINISSKSQKAMKVGVYDILGKQVINTTVGNNRLDVSNLTTGIYIMKISQDDAATTKKLVIK